MLSLFGTTIQVINFKEAYLDAALDILKDIVDTVDLPLNYPCELDVESIKSLLEDLKLHYTYSDEDNNVVINIRFKFGDNGDELFDTYVTLFNWFKSVLSKNIDLDDVFNANLKYENKFELLYAVKCIRSILIRTELD